MYLDGGMGGGGWLLTSFFSIIYILGLVCYKHTIHVIPTHIHTHTHTLHHRLVVKKIVPAAVSDWRPLVVLANPRSGGNDGPKVLSGFRKLLNPIQVWRVGGRRVGSQIEIHKKCLVLRLCYYYESH